ncbi:MAG: ankyrin repeat domain-containing protein, partial [Hyphomicrobium sp.]
VSGTIDTQSANGNTALILAAGAGKAAAVGKILASKASLDIRNTEGFTGLMLATREGHGQVVQVLIDAGADRSLRNKRRETAHDIAILTGQVGLAALLE